MLETMLRYDTATEKKTVDGVLSGLAPKKQLAYHLIQAANAGRTLLFQRTHRHSLAILLATTHRVTGAVLTERGRQRVARVATACQPATKAGFWIKGQGARNLRIPYLTCGTLCHETLASGKRHAE